MFSYIPRASGDDPDQHPSPLEYHNIVHPYLTAHDTTCQHEYPYQHSQMNSHECQDDFHL